jgi:putative membrane protein
MTDKKISIYSIFTALFAETLLVFIIYLNPFKIASIFAQETHVIINGSLNGLSAIFLFIAIFFIKNKKVFLHKVFIGLAILSSALFLISYILYHMSIGHTVFSNLEFRNIYLIILATHLMASFISLPLIFTTTIFGLFNRLKSHKKLAMLTFVLWEYVSITGVIIVYFLLELNK